MKLLRFTGLVAALVLSMASTVHAGGYDTPILYTARHQGMGGTAVAYVHDPSALFHNPAGLGHTPRASILGDFTLLIGNIQGSPASSAINTDANTTVAPLGLLGGSVRITDFLVGGLAVYPVASAGATYEYGNFTDKTTLVFIEVSPGLAVNLLDDRLRIGAGYRITYLSVDRLVQAEGAQPGIEFTLSGTNFASFRAGIQYSILKDEPLSNAASRRSVEVGFTYRHKTTVEVEDAEARVLSMPVSDVQSEFTLPTRFAFGARGDFGRFGAALDVEYALQSENDESVISAELGGSRVPVANIFEWQDALTLRVGLEYRLLLQGELAVRAGYAFDGQVANEQYPTAFGTPPGPGHIVTVGGGYDLGQLELNAAYAFRTVSGEVTEADLMAEGRRACAFCGYQGSYELTMHGIYLDASYDFE